MLFRIEILLTLTIQIDLLADIDIIPIIDWYITIDIVNTQKLDRHNNYQEQNIVKELLKNIKYHSDSRNW